MIIEENINGYLFQEQRTYKIYRSEADRTSGIFLLATSSEETFLEYKKDYKQREENRQKENLSKNI